MTRRRKPPTARPATADLVGPRLLTTPEVLALFGVSLSGLNKLSRPGKPLHAAKVKIGAAVRWRPEVIEGYIGRREA